LHTDPPIFYCGSLIGLDSNERGRRGAWIIDVDADGKVQTTMCPIASLVWHEIVIDVTGIDPNDYEKELQAIVEKATTEWDNVKMVSLQVIWRGEVKEGAKAKDALKKIEGIYFTLNKQGEFIDCHVHTSIIEIKPAVDLQLLSQEKTILGLIAKQLLELEPKAQSVQRMRRFIDQMASSYPHFSFSSDEETLAEELRKKGYEILLEILDQRKGG
jgi:DNA repair exonuclease SbcCD nuclease subunit